MAKERLEEKRRYTRIIFNEWNRVQALLFLSEQQDSAQEIPASVLNMSEGGMQVSIERKRFQEMRQGDTILLSHIRGGHGLEALRRLPMQIVWIMDNEYLEHVLLGMAFAVLSERQREILRSFVENRLSLAVETGKGEWMISS